MYRSTLLFLTGAASVAFASPAVTQTQTVQMPGLADPWIVNPIVNATHASRGLEKRAQCAATLNLATTITNRLQSQYYNSGAGNYNGGGFWDDVNTYETLSNLMLAQGSTTWASQMLGSSTIKAGANSNRDWNAFVGDYNDDAQWVALAYFKTADYQGAHGQDTSQYIASAIGIYNAVVAQWDGTCSGGVWWSKAHTYKNAITNELFLSLSALGYLRTGQAVFLNNAKMVWSWLLNSGMRNSQGLWNDGLDSSTCKNNNGNPWSYNQGVLLSGLGWLYQGTGDSSYLTQAQTTLDAAVKALVQSNGIMKETCDNPAKGAGNCGTDGDNFKGIFMKHLQYFLDGANQASITPKYTTFINNQKTGVINYGKSASNDIGSVWYAPDQGGSQWNAESSASGLAALVAAAKYGSC